LLTPSSSAQARSCWAICYWCSRSGRSRAAQGNRVGPGRGEDSAGRWLDPLPDQHRHPVAPRHDLVIVRRRLADHVADGPPLLVRHEDAAHPLSDHVPDALVAPQGGRDIHADGIAVPPPAVLHRILPRPSGPGQEPALSPPVAPADDLEPAVAPDGY